MEILLSITIFLAFGAVFVLANLLVGAFVRPKVPNPEKASVYECGEPSIGSSWVQFDLRFYIVALLYLIFDVEVAPSPTAMRRSWAATSAFQRSTSAWWRLSTCCFSSACFWSGSLTCGGLGTWTGCGRRRQPASRSAINPESTSASRPESISPSKYSLNACRHEI
jgi:hypothetical protein